MGNLRFLEGRPEAYESQPFRSAGEVEAGVSIKLGIDDDLAEGLGPADGGRQPMSLRGGEFL